MKISATSRFCLLIAACAFMLSVPKWVVAQEDVRSIISSYLKAETSKGGAQELVDLEWNISDSYKERTTGLSYAYVQQEYKGIPIFNSISIFVIKDDKVVHGQPNLIPNLSDKVVSVNPNTNAKDAVEAAFLHLERPNPKRLSEIEKSKNGHFRFEASEISSSPIEVYLTLVLVNDEIKLAWNINIEMKNEPHWWSIRMDALTGEFIEKNDFTVQCNFSESHNHSSEEQTICSDQLPPFPVAPSPPGSAYNIYPLPIEAPTFGSRSLLSDPADYSASPFGWHDTNGVSGAEHTITRGNNVYTYEDANNDNLPGYSPDGGGSLNFDFAITPNVAPIVNQDAALANMFAQTNVVHDVLYHLGFDEAAGNFQVNNYGNGGTAGDAVLAEGFDGSGTNNANFSTPADGSSPRMQMYLWNSVPPGCTSLNIASTSFTGSMTVGTGEFTASGSVTADLILAYDGVGTTSDACSNITNSVTGKIVVIDRGSCTFVSKAQRAELAGALGMIIVNNQAGPATNMTGSPVVGIPCVLVSQADGAILKAALLAGTVQGTLVTCAAEAFDSNFDNGVIVHEFGHGVSNRLTGGPSQAACLTNAEQGGEGWSDWLALMLTIKSGDVGTDARGVGSYVSNQASNGGGIRRFPYSTDMNVNPQTYGDLALSINVHQNGEIWCDAVWDMSWLLMDEFGYDSDPTVVTAGNNIAIRLVLTGMKLQPCSPGFLDARDGILAADILLYGGAHKALIWQAFARRGMGCSAAQGSANVIGDETEAFDEPDTYYLDGDNDGFGDLASTQIACSQPIGYVTNADDCDDADSQFGPCIMWTGATNSIWETASNWFGNVVPDQDDDVLISSDPSNQPHVTSASTSPAKCHNLKIQSGVLTVNSGKALTINGTTANSGTILIKADATGIGSLITQGTVTGAGAFQMEQYITGAGGATPNGLFYYVSSPVASASSNVYSAAGDNKLWSANEATQSYSEITDNSTGLNVGQGYVARLGATATETFTGGAFNTGNQSATGLTRTGNAEANRGYNLVGNPYPSTVSWDNATKTNLETTLWYRTHQGSTMLYDTYNATSSIGTNNNGNGVATGAIAPTQGFWVRVNADGNTGQLDFTNAMRSHGTLAGIYRLAASEGVVRMTLSNGTNSDEAILLFDENATDDFDAYDSHKFWASNIPQLYMNESEDTLVINGLYSTATNPIVDLGVKLPTSGNYTLNANQITIVGETVFLEDRLLNIFQDLNVESNYAFTSVAGNIGDRFALHFGMSITGIGTDAINRVSTRVYTFNGNTLNIILSENTENGKAEVMDMAGRAVGSFYLNATRTSVDMNVSTGVYLIRVETEKGTDTHRILIK